MGKLFDKNPLFYAFLLPLTADAVFTLIGQDSIYWQNYKNVNEMAPVYILLTIHPMAYILFEAAWFVFVYWLVKKLKHPINLMITLLFITGHTYGSTGWVLKIMRDVNFYQPLDRFSTTITWITMIGYFALIGIWSGYFISRYFSHRRT